METTTTVARRRNVVGRPPWRRDMITAEAVVDVDAPAAEAWSVVADYARDPQWRTGVRSMVPAPPGVVRPGTTTAEVLRAAGRTMHNDGVVTTVEPGRRFTWRTTSGVSAEGSRAVVRNGDAGCRVELTLRCTPPGLLRLVPWAVRGSVRRGLRRDAARLRALIELGGADDRAPDHDDRSGSPVDR